MCFIGVKFMPRHITVSQEKWWCLGNKTTTSLQHLLHNRIISFLALGFYKHNTELYKNHRNKINSLENPSWDLPDLQWQPVWASTERPAGCSTSGLPRKLWRAVSSSPNSPGGRHNKIPPGTARSHMGGPQLHENTQSHRSHKCRMYSWPNTVVAVLWSVRPESVVLCTGRVEYFMLKALKGGTKKALAQKCSLSKSTAQLTDSAAPSSAEKPGMTAINHSKIFFSCRGEGTVKIWTWKLAHF